MEKRTKQEAVPRASKLNGKNIERESATSSRPPIPHGIL